MNSYEKVFNCNIYKRIFKRLFLFAEEGAKPIFDRDEIKYWIPDVPEKRVIAMISEKSSQREFANLSMSPPRRRIEHSNQMASAKRSRSRSPHNISGKSYPVIKF